jgi:adhesin HecA-like repeat protein
VPWNVSGGTVSVGGNLGANVPSLTLSNGTVGGAGDLTVSGVSVGRGAS